MRTTHKILMDDEYIRKAQRLAISQNKFLRLIYQTWWVVWIPRIVLFVGTVICLAVDFLRPVAAVCAVILLVSFAGEIFKRRSLAKARQKVREKDTVTVVTMEEQGVGISGTFGKSDLQWKIMLEPVIYSDGVLIKLSRANMVWLPDTALVEGSPADVRQLLAVNVKVC